MFSSLAFCQCAGNASTPAAAAACTSAAKPLEKRTSIDPKHPYSLPELIDIAEQNNPRTLVAWERAKQRADLLGIARSAYYPVLAGLATFADQRVISPFPKPLAPLGYTLVTAPLVEPAIELQYLLLDFGRRAAKVDAATAQQLAAGANFVQTNQDVAFRVASAFYSLVTAKERLQSTQETLKTAQTTQDAAEDQLRNGRSTRPDVLNARAETAQALFDLESAEGDELIARVALTETIGVEPTPNIEIDGQASASLPQQLTLTIDSLIDRALTNRPDLMAQAAEIRAADDEIRAAKSAYRPTLSVRANGAQTSIWPTSSYGELGSASKPTWSAAAVFEWRLFDGGARRNELEEALSKRREANDELTEIRDQSVRQVWTAYIGFRTALKKHSAALALLESANESYSASLDAFKFGVKNLIDVVTAEKQLAQARLSGVTARSQLLLQAVNLDFVTGSLLRNQLPATSNKPQENSVPNDPDKK